MPSGLGALIKFQNGVIAERFGDMLFAVEARGRKKRTVLAALAILAMGFPPFVNSLDNPRLVGLRGPDVLQLLAIGLCVGLALGVFLVGFLGGRRSS